MRLYTIHAAAPPPTGPEPEEWRPVPKPRAPVLLREGFSVYPFLFGFLWFLAQRLWIEAAVLFVLTVAAGVFLPDPFDGVAVLALHLVAGFEGRDRLRARLARQGLLEQGVIAAPDLDLAWFRLAQQRPDLVRAIP